MSGDDTRGDEPRGDEPRGDEPRGDEPRGNGIEGKGHLRDGHLRDGHLRKGHLRGNESTLRSIQGGAGGVNVDLNVDRGDDAFSVPDLLATDALLDRLGRHEASDGDLRDTVARILDAYALNADPETAGVRSVELPEIDTASAFVAQPATAPRVLLAHRRTLTRLGRGTVAAAAVLALLGGTAAAAATGAGSLGGRDPGASTSFSAQLPDWFPDTVFRAFGGTPEERATRELKQAQKEALSGDSATAKARLENLQKQLGEAEVDADVAATLASAVQETLDQIENETVALPTPTTSPSGSGAATGSPSPSTTTSLADVASTATPSTGDWQIPQKPRTPGSGTATGTPTTAPTTAPTTGAGSGGSVATTPPKTTTGSVPNVPVVPVTPSGPVVNPPATDTPTDSPTTAPTDTPTTGTTPTETTPTTGPTSPTPTDTPPVVVPPVEATTGAPTTEPTSGPTVGETPGTSPGETPTTTDPIEVVTPTLPVVVEPSPSAGVEPSPGADDASTTAPAGS